MRKILLLITVTLLALVLGCDDEEKPKPSASIAGNTVYDIGFDKDGSVWFGTDNGASRFDGMTWTTYRKK